ncbi:hypothetical protein [Streptomyces sp. Je 1-369]|uniref:hypothetical protein n=1 Tax=Streptomyces sp. Je 1-369 TaxID=2966192 RepID=UPI0022861756|nr:hypothetical protein [Streptomyces sp. Je 1-369]WAL93646.1 hypothetical protein NOO62_03550 [Streptomyces sp. Je 1-369]
MSVVMVNATNLLPYEPSTDPKPLRVSSAEETEYGSVNINVGGGITTSAWCNKITARVPVGAGAEHLTTEGADIKTGASTGWTPSAPTVSGGFAVITFTPARAVQFTGQIVTLTLSNIAVNRTAGQVSIAIVESSSGTNGSFTNKDASVKVDKFPAGFVFRNFAPEKIMVENGEVAVLHWEGSDAKYTMHWGDTPAGVSLDKERVWSTPRGLTTVTGFMLRAEVTAGGVTLTHTLTTAVTVRIPDLVVRNLTVQGPATFADSVSLSNTAKDLTVAGSVRGAGSTPLRVSQPAGLKVDAVLNVTGASTFANSVSLSNTAKDLTVAGSVRGAGSNPLRVSQPAGLKVDAVLNVTGASTFNNSITTIRDVTAAGNIKAGGNRVLREGDTLRFVSHTNRYLQEGPDYGGEKEVAQTSRTRYTNARWRAQHFSSASSFGEEPEGKQEPEDRAQDERILTADPEL